jgi:hypothetical protein
VNLGQNDGTVWDGSRWITDPDRIGEVDYSQSPVLQRVRDAAAARAQVETEHRAAVVAAIEAGASYRSVMKAAGYKSVSSIQHIIGSGRP